LTLLNSVEDQETRGIVLANAATVYVDQGDIETAESFFAESIQIAQKLEDRLAESTRRGNYGGSCSQPRPNAQYRRLRSPSSRAKIWDPITERRADR
jgi:hypothetical protein